MKENTLNKVILLCLLAVMVSCKAKKVIVARTKADSSATVPVNNTTSKIAQIKSAQLTFITFSGKAHAKLDINGNTNDVTLTVRISNGKKIWVSVTAIAGIEVARALITPDSLLVINRLQGVYLKKPFNYIYKYAGNQVNYKTVESLLVGNAIPELLKNDDKLLPENGNINLSGNLQDLIFKMMLGPDLKVTTLNLSSLNINQVLQVTNRDFISSGNKIVASQIDISSTAKNQKVLINLNYFKVDFDLPLEYPFTIPERYTPQD